jgi:hypothetical protein
MPAKPHKNQKPAPRNGAAVKPGIEFRVLWRARLRIGAGKDEFLYRCTEDFTLASATAEGLLQASTAASMVGAVITGIERQARLWN